MFFKTKIISLFYCYRNLDLTSFCLSSNSFSKVIETRQSIMYVHDCMISIKYRMQWCLSILYRTQAVIYFVLVVLKYIFGCRWCQQSSPVTWRTLGSRVWLRWKRNIMRRKSCRRRSPLREVAEACRWMMIS